VLLKIAFGLIGVLLFLFLFWKKLKEDYESEIIFTSAFYILFGIAGGLLISVRFFPNWWFWLAFLSSTVALIIAVIKFNLRILEATEAWVVANLVLFGLAVLVDYIQNPTLFSGIGTFLVLVLFISYFFIDKHYKSFRWYKSGRVGFSGLTILAVFFLTRAVVAVAFTDMLFCMWKIDSVMSGVVAFVCFLVIFSLAKNST
jgi:hypothetical protein